MGTISIPWLTDGEGQIDVIRIGLAKYNYLNYDMTPDGLVGNRNLMF